VIPVDPVLTIVGDRAPEHVIRRVRGDGLNKPRWQQFGLYVSKALRGEFGTSVLTANGLGRYQENLPGHARTRHRQHPDRRRPGRAVEQSGRQCAEAGGWTMPCA
jgi:hypothetical protein